MKRLLLALLTVLVFASPAFAIVGGPWDNNVPGNPVPVNPSSSDGTYAATLKGKNIAGVLRFTSTPSGLVTVSSTTYLAQIRDWYTGIWQVSGTVITPSTVASSGFASFFFEGKQGIATVDTLILPGDRMISGVIEGAGKRKVEQTLVRPATQTTAAMTWRLNDSVYFNGSFSAKFTSNWAKNAFTGKGYLSVTKFDFDAWSADLVANPTTANPQDHIVTVPTVVKITGNKMSDAASPITAPAIVPALPIIN